MLRVNESQMYSSARKTNKSVNSFHTPEQYYDAEQVLENELETLRLQRNELCNLFFKKEVRIPDFCMALDQLGKQFADNCFFASTRGYCK